MIRTLLLAAGASRRFGRNKLLEPLPDGTPVVVRCASTLLEARGSLLAVVRGADGATQRLLSEMPGVELTPCPDPNAGMGDSLAWGVSRSADARGWLIALADMPFLKAETVRSLGTVLEAGASIVVATHLGRQGHPVGFDQRWRDQLRSLRGDRGGRAILHAHPDAVRYVSCEDPGVVADIDIPADLPSSHRCLHGLTK